MINLIKVINLINPKTRLMGLVCLLNIFIVCAASNCKTVNSIMVKYENYENGYAVCVDSVFYKHEGNAFISTASDSNCSKYNIPKSIDSDVVYDMLHVVDSCKVNCSRNLLSFSASDINKLIAYINDPKQSGYDGLYLETFGLNYESAMTELTHLASMSQKQIDVALNDEGVTFHNSFFSIRILFDDGEHLTISPRSIYYGDYWKIGDNSYLKDEYMRMFIEQSKLSKLLFQLDKCEMILSILRHRHSC